MCLKMSAVLAISGSYNLLEMSYLFIQAVNILSKIKNKKYRQISSSELNKDWLCMRDNKHLYLFHNIRQLVNLGCFIIEEGLPLGHCDQKDQMPQTSTQDMDFRLGQVAWAAVNKLTYCELFQLRKGVAKVSANSPTNDINTIYNTMLIN